ncbi:unnamed protein product [Paramecium sonneborni]|uniref:Uncharacterized protein n=1 Tax=Paramecium sonneborni TaxID=65129 RepID=A0A8S1LCI4_9CILI|nr:unnamed protein product [Paramecium sonneborni]
MFYQLQREEIQCRSKYLNIGNTNQTPKAHQIMNLGYYIQFEIKQGKLWKFAYNIKLLYIRKYSKQSSKNWKFENAVQRIE